jgi:hypothetical protein
METTRKKGVRGRATSLNLYTRKKFEEFLNKNSPPEGDDKWIIGGKRRHYKKESPHYGRALKTHDNTQFESFYLDWKRAMIFNKKLYT